MKLSSRYTKIVYLFFLFSLLGFGSIPPALAQDPYPNKNYLPVVRFAENPAWMGPDGGSVICLAIDPVNQDIVYAGTLNAGVFKSINRGTTWSQVNTGLGDLFIDSITIDPSNGNTIYAGTHGYGVYKSTNGGQSWYPVNNGIAANSVVYSLAVNPSNSNMLFAGTRIQNTEYIGILYRSLNGGASWENVMYFPDDWVYSVAIKPSQPNVVLAAVHTGGPMVSFENGKSGSWNNGAPPDGIIDDGLVERWQKGRAVAFDPRPGTGLAHYTAWHDGLISYSSNNGTKWNSSGGSLGGAQIYPNGISIKPGNPDIVYLADHDRGSRDGVTIPGYVMRSTNAGLTYQPTNLSRIFYTVAALRGSGDSVLAGTYLDGLYKSDNGGQSWYHSMSGLVNSRVTGMVFPTSNTVIASTRSGGGIFRSTDSGASWTLFNSGLGDTAINGLISHPSNPNILFALTNSAGLRRVDLSVSSSWSTAALVSMASAAPVPENTTMSVSAASEALGEMIDPGDEALFQVEMNASAASAPLLDLAFAPSNANIAYLGTNGGGMYASGDGGTTWSYVGLGQGVVRGIAVSPNNPSLVYAATNEIGLARISSDGGRTWVSAGLPNTGAAVYSVAILPSRPNDVFFGTSSGVYRYNGSGWTHVGLAGYQVFTLGYHPTATSRLVAGTNGGGFIAFNGSEPWSSLANELVDKVIVSLNFNPFLTRYVYAGTEYRGTLRVPVEQ